MNRNEQQEDVRKVQDGPKPASNNTDTMFIKDKVKVSPLKMGTETDQQELTYICKLRKKERSQEPVEAVYARLMDAAQVTETKD